MKIKFSNFVKLFLAGASLLAVGCTDYGHDIQNLNDRIDKLETDAIEPLKVDLKAIQDDLAAAKDDLQKKIDANTTLINGVNDDLKTAQENIAANKTAVDAVKGDLEKTDALVATINGQVATLVENVAALADKDAEFAKTIEQLQLAISNNTAAIEELKAKNQSLENALNTHVKTYEALVLALQTEVNVLKGQVKDLQDKDAQIDETIAKIDDRLKANEELAKQNKANLEAAVETLGILQNAHNVLAGEFKTFSEGVRKELDDHYAAFKAAVERITTLETTQADHANRIAATEDAIETLKTDVGTLKTDLAQAQSDLADLTKELSDYKDEMKKALEERDGKIQANADAIKKLTDELLPALEDRLTDAINAAKTALEAQIKILEGDLSALKGRVQSLVFVPEHVDGAATIHWAQIVNDKQETVIVEAQSTLLFQVYPADCAAAIKPADLKFVFSDALADTRTNNKVLDVVAVDVVKDKEGVIAVKVNARDFSDEFYDGDKKYAASLVFTTETANIASCYVNLAPATPKAIEVALVPNTGEYTLPYTPAKQKVHILPEHKYVFTIDGTGSNTIEGMLDAGYEIEVTKHDPVYTCSDPNKINEFVNTPAPDEKKPYLNFVTVELANAKPENVGLVETITYAYTVCGKTVEAVSTVEVTKVKGSIDLKTKITWNYAEDAKSDAGLELTNSTDPAEIVASNLPDGIDYMRVIKEGSILSKSIKIGNTDATTVTVDFLEGAEPQIKSSNYLWGNTYNVEYVYDLPSCTITLNATIETKDRVREKIFVELLDSEKVVEYKTSYVFENSLTDVKDLKVKDPAQKTIFEQIVAYKTEVGEMTEAEFLKEVLVDKKNGKYVLSNTYSYGNNNGVEATATTLLSISADGVESTVSFSYVDVTSMPKSVKHVYNVTTWYGQVIEIVKTVNFELPTAFNFISEPFWVNDKVVSNVVPEYTYPSVVYPNALSAFSLRDIQLWDAFHITNNGVAFYPQGDTNLKQREDLSKYLASNNLKLEYKVVTPGYDNAIDNANGVWTLAYPSKPASLNVVGALYLNTGVKDANGDDEYVKLPTKFDNEYKNYTVNGFNPIEGPFIVDTTLGSDTDLTKITLVDAKVYQVNIWEMLQIKDRRGVELFANGNWVVGDNTNGFYTDGTTPSNPSEIYGAEMTFVLDGNIPAGIAPKIKYYEHTGIIEFDYTTKFELQDVLNLSVYVTLTHKHGKDVTTTIPLTVVAK